MEGAQLKEYLKIAIDMEQSVYIQERTLRDFPKFQEVKLGTLAHPRAPGKPSQPPKPPKPHLVAGLLGAIQISMVFFVPGMLLLIGCILVNLDANQEVPYWDKLDNPLIAPLLIPVVLVSMFAAATPVFYYILLIAGIIGIVIAIGIVVIGMMSVLEEIRSDKASYESRMRDWERQCNEYPEKEKEYQKQCAAFESRLAALQKKEKELNEEKSHAYSREKTMLINQLVQTRENLQKLYSLNVIFPKYRNLPMLCSLYEYICAGRCTTLEGHEGGYNILESEMRLDRIVTQMDRVISNLGQIQQNQYLLHATMQDSVRRTDQLISSTNRMIASTGSMTDALSKQSKSLEDIQKNSAITAYCLEENRKEMEYLKRYL